MDMGADKATRVSWLANLFEIARVIAFAVVLALLIRVLLIQPFNIPTGSMIPTLLVGDYLFISKYSYGFSRYSLPFKLPLFKGRLFGREPERGDVVVFDVDGTDYIKRLIGLPGDRIQMRNGRLAINGVELERHSLPPYLTRDLYGYEREITRYEETLPNHKSYATLDLIAESAGDNTREYSVPAEHYFMLGDNRDNSSDSRFSAPIGFVPRENLIGKAQFLYFSQAEAAQGRAPAPDDGVIRWERILMKVR